MSIQSLTLSLLGLLCSCFFWGCDTAPSAPRGATLHGHIVAAGITRSAIGVTADLRLQGPPVCGRLPWQQRLVLWSNFTLRQQVEVWSWKEGKTPSPQLNIELIVRRDPKGNLSLHERQLLFGSTGPILRTRNLSRVAGEWFVAEDGLPPVAAEMYEAIGLQNIDEATQSFERLLSLAGALSLAQNNHLQLAGSSPNLFRCPLGPAERHLWLDTLSEEARPVKLDAWIERGNDRLVKDAPLRRHLLMEMDSLQNGEHFLIELSDEIAPWSGAIQAPLKAITHRREVGYAVVLRSIRRVLLRRWFGWRSHD